MKINELCTPATLLDLDAAAHNMEKYAESAKRAGKQIWPMLKTHKSLELAKAQAEAGASGFLCGTLDEAEMLCEAGYKNLMYAYPVATDASIRRVLALSRKSSFIVRLDTEEAAAALDRAAAEESTLVNYTIIVDSGFHRFGVKVEQLAAFAAKMRRYKNLVFKGISTHPGHVYGASSAADIGRYVADERDTMKRAVAELKTVGLVPEIVSSGSAPTFFGTIDAEDIDVYHPGNYIFHDVIQLCTDTANEEECALRVLTAVISHPSEDLYICDAGAKCLGLDQGAHGNTSIKGFGLVKGHPELTVEGLSEEAGKIRAHGATSLKVGDIIEIIPNHSCAAANLTGYYIGVRGDEVDHLIKVNARGNSCQKVPIEKQG